MGTVTTGEESYPHVVIIGAGFAGLSAARKLGSFPVRVTVVDRRNHHLFQPLLYQVATAGLSPANIAMPIRAILRRQKNTEVLLGEVSGIDLESRTVLLRDRTLKFDFLIVATGAGQSYFGHPGWECFAPGLKTVEDAVRIRRQILLAFEKAEMEPDAEKRAELLRFIIVGGGPTGVEMAGAIAELAQFALTKDFRRIRPQEAEVVLVEAGPRLLAAFPEDLAEKARRSLERLGVDVRTGARVENVTERGVVLGGKLHASSTVIWAAGVAASPAAKWLGTETDRLGRAVVFPDLSIVGHPEIFVIGDTASFVQDGVPLPGLAPVALQQGRYVASLIRNEILSGVPGPDARKPFRYRDKGQLATIGRRAAIANVGAMKFSGFFAWIVWLFVHILYLIGFRNRMLVLIEWTWAYVTFQRGSRLITDSSQP